MNSMFTFSWSCGGYTFQVLFKAPGSTPAIYVAEAIKDAAQEVLYPDGIILLNVDGDDSEMQSILGDDALQGALKRLGTKTGLYTATIGPDQKNVETKVVESMPLADFITGKLRETDVLADMFKAGIQQIFTSKKIVIPAPPGYHFQKPSGDSASHFIRAEEVLSHSQVVDFLALALLVRMGKRENLKTIYIDTMGISSVAYALRELLRRSQSNNIIPRIVSFHSHDGLDKIDSPMPGTAYCIISASSSLSLEQKWIEKTRCKSDDVVTLATFKGAVGDENAIFTFERPDNWAEHGAIPTLGTRGLRTLGERFQQEQMPLKKVTLSRDHHPLSTTKDLAQQFWSLPFLNVDVATPNGRRRTFYAEGTLLVKNRTFQKWLEKELRSKVPASIQGIIYQNDSASLTLARKCRNYLKKFKVELPWGMHSSDTYERHLDTLDSKRGLLILAAVIGQGHTLLGISRDLRARHEGSKLYLIGLQVCAEKSESKFLRSNLSNTKDGTNGFNLWNCLATGSAMHQSLKREESLYRTHPALKPLFDYRHSRQVNVGLGEAALLPTAIGNASLGLRKDFLFWPEGYKEGSQHVALVLATIGAILEHARTDKKMDERYCMHSDTVQHVILDPQNFNRFNDGIIQASLLRQAYPSELNYSATHEESGFMREFLLKIFSARNKPQGEAALEFALALAIHRLKIQKTDLEIVCSRTTELLTASDFDKHLLILLNLARNQPPSNSPAF
ncbi:hypothetical protein [Pusillimonas sp. ANT_WB101]|uniref:hypothetical protein n=1 Tax=Pusillimonas sp. ANT_WB101 TaxID=2597356 RepID=UPI0011EC51F7|nr:hypothetical protein [Pusillimonas sp. ANT_WB101]KAA0892551.1 hypothetical protein FQ179_09535 [Pusillimonas sp. ANT_WB101]